MGRRDKWAAEAHSTQGTAWRSYSGAHQYPWSVWQGAWRSPKGHRQPKGESKGTYHFPAYDEDRKEQLGIVEVAESRQPKSAEPTLVQAVQTACNHARKLDGRVQKLQTDLERKDRQWKSYMVDLKAAFRAEKQRHANAVKKIENDLQEAMVQQKEAHQRLGQFYAEPTDTIAEGDLHAAMQVIQRHFGGQSSGAAPCTPPRRTGPWPSLTPTHGKPAISRVVDQPSPPHFGTPVDPYPSPVPHGPPGPEQASPTPATPPTSRSKPEAGKQRQPVKKLPQQIPHTDSNAQTLSDKLRDKRSALIAQQQAQAAAAAVKTDEPVPPKGPAEINLVDDDDDEDEFMEDRSMMRRSFVPEVAFTSYGVFRQVKGIGDARYSVQVLDCAPSVPDGVMNRAVPLRPQRVQGYLSMIRFPSIIGGVHDGYAAIAINMSHVHGAYFATVMPKSLSYAELLSFIDPAAQDEDPPFEIYIGSRQYPWPPQEQVTLGDGDVVTVMRHGLGAPSMLLAEDLVNPQTWGTVSPFFHIEPLSRTCVMHGGRRFCVAPHHHTDQTLIEHAVNSLRLDLGRIATCTFCTSDLDVRGYWCPWTVAVADVPALADSEASRARQDFFLLCDLRPLGLKPVFVHTHVPKLHVSSFLSDFGIDIPPAMQLGIQGGRFSKDYVSFDDSCVLLFFVLEAEPFPRAGSSSPEEEEDQSSSASSNPPADSDHENSPHGNDCASVPAPDVEAPGLRDSTLPVGHSWNASSIPESWSGERSLAALHAWDTSAAPEQAGFAVPFPDADPPASSRDPASADVVFEISPTPLLPDTGSLAGGLEATVSQAPVSANPDVTVNMPPAADVDDASPNEPVNLRAFIYVPDTIPEMLSASAFLPCSVDAAMSAFAWARAAEDTVRYSKVVPVAPQPFSECIIAVAFPNWFDSRPVVLLDCRRINHTIFAKALYDRLNRESLLLAAGQRTLFRSDLAIHLQVPEHSLVLKTSHPRVIDGYLDGRLTSGLIIATQQVSRLPCPPARIRDDRLLIFLDARPILQGFQWMIADHTDIPASRVAQRFEDSCPPDHTISISGAVVFSFGDEQFLSLEDGLLLTIEYTEEMPSPDPSSSGSPPPDDGHADDRPPDSSTDEPRPSRHNMPSSDNSRNRSRSPRGDLSVLTGIVSRRCGSFQPRHLVTLQRLVTWSASLLHDALVESYWHLTPVLRGSLFATHASLACLGEYKVFSVGSWIMSACLALLQARTGSPPPSFEVEASFGLNSDAMSASSPVAVSDASSLPSAIDFEDTLVDVVFVLLAPDYAPEEVAMQLALPQSVCDAFEVLETCRGLANKELFPTLCMVWPQPDPRIDGRVFAFRAHRVIDRLRLLILAGFPADADVDVFVPTLPDPLASGEEFRLTMGDCIIFAPPGSLAEPTISLREMLSTHLPWLPGPAFPAPIENRYCIVSASRYCDFVLQPDRAFTYKADIALRLDLPANNPLLTPARDRQQDVSIDGRLCRTVVAVGIQVGIGAWLRRDGLILTLYVKVLFSGYLKDGTREVIRVTFVRDPSDWTSPEEVSGPAFPCTGEVFDMPPDWDSGRASMQASPPEETVPFAKLFPYGRTAVCRANWDYPPSATGHTGAPHNAHSLQSSTVALWYGAAPRSSRDTVLWLILASLTCACLSLFPSLALSLLPDPALWQTLSPGCIVEDLPAGHANADKWTWSYHDDGIRDADFVDTPVGHQAGPAAPISSPFAVDGYLLSLLLLLPSLRRSGHNSLGFPVGLCCYGLLARLWFWSVVTAVQIPPIATSSTEVGLSSGKLPALTPRLPHIPTPCRNWALPPTCPRDHALHDAVDEHVGPVADLARTTAIGVGPTLLDVCFSEHGESLFFEARALVEDWLDDDLSVLLYDHQVPLEMRTIFVSIRSWYHAGKPPVSYLEVYTDGSASSQSHDGRPRAWAVTVWAVSGQERLLVGCAAAPAAPEGTPHHLGENQQCALTGELLALCWSLAWTCEFARSYHVPVWHLYDAKGAGEGVFGCCKAPLALHHEPSPFARLYTLATSLRQVASSRVALHHGYVAGHSGTLGNELADQFAKRARREADDPWNRCLPMWPAQLARHPLLLWAWALHPAVPDVPSLYAFETEALRLQALDLPPTQAPMQGLVRSSLSDGDVHFHLTLVTFNVLTLLERSLTRRAETCVPEDQSRPVGMRIFGRKAVLKSSLEEVSPHIVGLQETRLPEASTRIDDEYHIFTSPANEKGSGGCALWLSKHRPYAQQEGVELKFSRDQVTVVSASSRHLAASILTPRLHLFVIVAHAPSFPSVSYEVLQTFWQVLCNFEALQLRDDHRPAMLTCRFAKRAPPVSYTTSARKAVRPKQPRTDAENSYVSSLLDTMPVHGWDIDVDAHCDSLAKDWCTVGQALSMHEHTSAIRPYATDEVLQLKTHEPYSNIFGMNLQSATAFSTDSVVKADRWLVEIDYGDARALALYSWFGRQLRQAVAAGRRAFLSEVVQEAASIGLGQPKALYTAIRRAFPAAKSARKSSLLPLPMLLDGDGTAIVSSEARDECWRTHFARQEAGDLVNSTDYVQRIQTERRFSKQVFDVDNVPSLGQLEQVLLRLKNGKAAGADGLTAEVLRLSPRDAARRLLPVIMKSTFALREPVSWRGGDLVLLAKKAGLAMSCEGFRSVLIASVAGKAYHRCIRAQLVPLLQDTAPELMAGAIANVGIEVPALAVRSFQGLLSALRVPWALIFVDLQSAYYQVLRQLLVPHHGSDQELLRLLHRLDLPPEAIAELKDKLVTLAQLPSYCI
ncbi:unnamed protein product [Symbiodinium sp. KB8]|nr:unnamed protein product [Symbiodinium sp. KB8]